MELKEITGKHPSRALFLSIFMGNYFMLFKIPIEIRGWETKLEQMTFLLFAHILKVIFMQLTYFSTPVLGNSQAFISNLIFSMNL